MRNRFFGQKPPKGKIQKFERSVRKKPQEETSKEEKQRLLKNIILNGSKRAKKRIERNK